MRPLAWWWVVPVLLGLAACGGKGAVFLTIEGEGLEGTLRIPDEVDRIAVRITNPEGTEVLLEKEYSLTAEHRFPLTLGLEPGPLTGALIRVTVTAFHADHLVGSTEAMVPINPREETAATVRLSTG